MKADKDFNCNVMAFSVQQYLGHKDYFQLFRNKMEGQKDEAHHANEEGRRVPLGYRFRSHCLPADHLARVGRLARASALTLDAK